MKIYTRTGDGGETGLRSGARLSKDDPLFEASGSLDELNALLGLCRCEDVPAPLGARLERVQSELFSVGADLAAPWGGRPGAAKTENTHAAAVRRLEEEIDEVQGGLKPLRRFILPAGSRAAASLHLARTVCRRAERAVVRVARAGRANPEVLSYLNRLSDWLFVMARLCNRKARRDDVAWKPAAPK